MEMECEAGVAITHESTGIPTGITGTQMRFKRKTNQALQGLK
jgi:hypothetical protein